MFDDIVKKNDEQADYIKERVLGLNEALETTLAIQNENAENRLKVIAEDMKTIIDGNIEVTSADYESLKAKLADFTLEMSSLNKSLSSNLKQQLDDIAKFIDSNLEVQGQETAEKFEEIQNTVTAQGQKLNSQVESVLETVKNDNSSLLENIRLKLQEIGNAFTTELTHVCNSVFKFMPVFHKQQHKRNIHKCTLAFVYIDPGKSFLSIGT